MVVKLVAVAVGEACAPRTHASVSVGGWFGCFLPTGCGCLVHARALVQGGKGTRSYAIGRLCFSYRYVRDSLLGLVRCGVSSCCTRGRFAVWARPGARRGPCSLWAGLCDKPNDIALHQRADAARRTQHARTGDSAQRWRSEAFASGPSNNKGGVLACSWISHELHASAGRRASACFAVRSLVIRMHGEGAVDSGGYAWFRWWLA